MWEPRDKNDALRIVSRSMLWGATQGSFSSGVYHVAIFAVESMSLKRIRYSGAAAAYGWVVSRAAQAVRQSGIPALLLGEAKGHALCMRCDVGDPSSVIALGAI